ncbi:glycerophosphodiester phosphodiesterase [Micrococcoides hystricis]|uniref:Glycerophosphodiester phosphodiesterase n=1 Tax=Micrococcoides hystricis TaxID=1572761 RepID=A0ABV6P6N3_9MICC
MGHRGCAGTQPENTLRGLSEALSMGVDGVEIDLRLTRDGVPVLLHDAHLNRTTNCESVEAFRGIKQLSVSELNLAQVVSLRTVDHLGSPTAETVPTLVQAAELIVETAAGWFIELKEPSPPGPWLHALVHTIQSSMTFRCLLARGQIQFLSFDHPALAAVGDLLRTHGYTVGLQPLVDTIPTGKELLQARLLGRTLGADQRWLTLESVQSAQDAGMRIHPYTVNSYQDAERVRRLGISAFTTDHPERFMHLRRAAEPAPGNSVPIR